MYDPNVFASGVYGVLKVHWVLRCETPLAIRNGKSVFYQTLDEKRTKSRGMGVRFEWKQPPPGSDTDHTVAALHYGYQVRNGALEQVHFVPPSSLRGSLRSWTISHLVQPDYRRGMSPPKKEDDAKTQENLDNLQAALNDPSSGYPWIASLFGLALETRTGKECISNAGRLRVETKPFESNRLPQPIVINGKPDQILAGPTNARRQMVVRNPLDRMTHASKEKGLHQFLEFSRRESFQVEMTIRNPVNSDLGLLSLWRRELNDGLLRLGALSSIGRGRVYIEKDKENYELWLGPGAPDIFDTNDLAPLQKPGDALAGLWNGYIIPPEKLDQFVVALETT